MNFTEYVEQKKKETLIENVETVRREIKEAWVQEKITTYLNSISNLLTREEVEEQIMTNFIVASKFCKDPSKQNISEKAAIEILGVEKLPPSGKKCIRFNKDGEKVIKTLGNTKSADFIIDDWIATQKYTNNFGGAQDNQRNDVIDFLRCGSKKYKVAAFVDGEYWDEYREELKEQFKGNPNVLITSVSEWTERNCQ